MSSQPTPPAHIVELAVQVAGWSPCRSKRGVVIFDRDGNFITNGHNHKPQGFACDGSEACKATCRRDAIHAEQYALLKAGTEARGAELLHVKAVDGQLVPSGGPSCVECSKLAIAAGITGVWLYHVHGWQRYPIVNFHNESLASQPTPPAGLKCPSCGSLKQERIAGLWLCQFCGHEWDDAPPASRVQEVIAEAERQLEGLYRDIGLVMTLIQRRPNPQLDDNDQIRRLQGWRERIDQIRPHLASQDQRIRELEQERDDALKDVAYHSDCRPNRRQAEKAMADAKALNDWRADVTAAVIVATKREGGLFFDDVPAAVKELGTRAEAAEARLAAHQHECECGVEKHGLGSQYVGYERCPKCGEVRCDTCLSTIPHLTNQFAAPSVGDPPAREHTHDCGLYLCDNHPQGLHECTCGAVRGQEKA
jgi:deoxycytidylate deaminase